MSIRIKETDAQIERWVQQELEAHFYETMNKAHKGIEDAVRHVLIEAIKAQPEYTSLLHGRLLGEFGLTDVNSKLDAVLNKWAQSVITYNQRKRFTIYAVQYNFRDVTALPEAKQLTEKGVSLEWLDWLLTQGDRTIIKEYVVAYPGPRSNSRTGLAIMKSVERGKWSVPSQYAGTVRNNWVSRAIEEISDDRLSDVIFRVIEPLW